MRSLCAPLLLLSCAHPSPAALPCGNCSPDAALPTPCTPGVDCDQVDAGSQSTLVPCQTDCFDMGEADGTEADAARSPPAPAIVLESEKVGVDMVSAMAVSADASRVYLLRTRNYDSRRLSLAVVSLDPVSGSQIGQTAFVSDGQPLSAGTYSLGVALLLDEPHQRLYLATYDVDRRGATQSSYLETYALDAHGDILGSLPLAVATVTGSDNTSSVVYALARHPTAPVLYVGGLQGVYAVTLDDMGVPQFPAMHDQLLRGSYKEAIAVASDGSKLYMGTYHLNPLGPRLEILALASDGSFLTAPGSGEGPWGYDIVDADSHAPYACHPSANCACNLGPLAVYNFLYSPGALFRRPRQADSLGLPGNLSVGALPLGSDGLPISGQEIVPVFGGAPMHGRAQAVDPARNVLWLASDVEVTDAFDGTTHVAGVEPNSFTLDGNLTPSASFSSPAALRIGVQAGERLEVAQNGTAVLLTERQTCYEGSLVNAKKGLHMNLAVTGYASVTDGTLPANVSNLTLTIDGRDGLGVYPASFRVSTDAQGLVPDSGCLDLDLVKNGGGAPILKNHSDLVALMIKVAPDLKFFKSAEQMALSLSFFEGDCSGTPIANITTKVDYGGTAAVVVPGYSLGVENQVALDRTRFQALQDRVTTYKQAADALPALAHPPAQFVVGCGSFRGMQGHLGQLSDELSIASKVGCNTLNISEFEPIPANQINSLFAATPFAHRRSWGSPLIYFPGKSGCLQRAGLLFDYEMGYQSTDVSMDSTCPDYFSDLFLDTFSASNADSSRSDIAYMAIADEPGSYFPELVLPPSLVPFQNYVKNNSGLDATAFGGANPNDWASLQLTGQFAALEAQAGRMVAPCVGLSALQCGRRFYFSMNYLQDSMMRGAEYVRRAFERRSGAYPLLYYDLNNYDDHWINPLSTTTEHQALTPDWKRINSVLDAFTEEWEHDRDAEADEYHAAVLHSSLSMAPPDDLPRPVGRPAGRMGGYVVGLVIGEHPWGAAYKALSLIGHGAKTIEFYTFGPTPALPGNGWSDNFAAYAPIARTSDLIGASESLTFPGEPPQRGGTNGNQIAIVLPTISYLWNGFSGVAYYEYEARGIYTALAHQSFGVDFLDEREIDEATLSHYAVVYLVGPNVSARARSALLTWVQGGGAVALTPGAAVADEFNQPDGQVDQILGTSLRSATALRVLAPQPIPAEESGKILAPSLSQVSGPAPLGFTSAPAGSIGLEYYSPQGPNNVATIAKKSGLGWLVLYSYLPGYSYLSSPDRTPRHHLPSGWDWSLGKSVALPLALGNVQSVVRIEDPATGEVLSGVQGLPLMSAQGVAVVLLNWTDQPIASVRVTVQNASAHLSASSALTGTIGTAMTVGSAAQVQMGIDYVDVLMLR